MGAKLKMVGLLTMGAVAGALTTIQFTAEARNSYGPLPLEEMQQLAAVFGIVKTDYVESVDEKKLISDAIGGMVSGLDPHSQYFDKKTFKEFREGTTGKFVGVGIEIGMEDGLVKVVSPIEGSPAFRAGLKAGDLNGRWFSDESYKASSITASNYVITCTGSDSMAQQKADVAGVVITVNQDGDFTRTGL